MLVYGKLFQLNFPLFPCRYEKIHDVTTLPFMFDRMFQSFNKKLRLITPPCLNPHSMLRFSLPCHALNQCEVLKPAWGVTNYPTWLKLLYTTSVAKSKFGNQITAIHSKDTLPTYG